MMAVIKKLILRNTVKENALIKCQVMKCKKNWWKMCQNWGSQNDCLTHTFLYQKKYKEMS